MAYKVCWITNRPPPSRIPLSQKPAARKQSRKPERGQRRGAPAALAARLQLRLRRADQGDARPRPPPPPPHLPPPPPSPPLPVTYPPPGPAPRFLFAEERGGASIFVEGTNRLAPVPPSSRLLRRGAGRPRAEGRPGGAGPAPPPSPRPPPPSCQAKKDGTRWRSGGRQGRAAGNTRHKHGGSGFTLGRVRALSGETSPSSSGPEGSSRLPDVNMAAREDRPFCPLPTWQLLLVAERHVRGRRSHSAYAQRRSEASSCQLF